MGWKNTLITILLAAVLTACVGLGIFFGVSSHRNKTDTSSQASSQEGGEEGTDLIGRVISLGDDYLSIELYTAADPQAEISYETLNVDTLTAAGETRFVILRADAQYFRIVGGERQPMTANALSAADFIVVTLDENGTQNILLLPTGSE